MWKSNFLYLASVAIITVIVGVSSECDPTWIENDGRCYKYFDLEDRVGINRARYVCRTHGAQPLLVESQDEENFIAGEASLALNENRSFMDATDNIDEGVWKTFNGEPLVWTKWNSGFGEPNNNPGGGDGDEENCAIRVGHSGGAWSDFACYATASWNIDVICEKSANPEIAAIGDVRKSVLVGIVEGRYFAAFNFLSTTASSTLLCINQCVDYYPKCISVNYREEDATCELNGGSHLESLYNLIPNNDNPATVSDASKWKYMNLVI